jgi:peptidoglycan/xylan/chitin deacetylase (PgdA/CDA1 family)
MRLLTACCFSAILPMFLCGCGTPASNWRNYAYNSFTAALSAGADSAAPDEVDTIRRTLDGAERFFSHDMGADADSLYRLAALESRLLRRSLLSATLRQGAVIGVESAGGEREGDVVELSGDLVSLDDAVRDEEQKQASPSIAGKAEHVPAPAPGMVSNSAQAGTSAVSKAIPSLAGPVSATIYLTFDDGPSRLTLPIATFLKSQGVAATFFVLGTNVKGHEKAITSLVAMGHRVGNHTFSHNLRKLRASFAGKANEVGRTAAMINRLGGDGLMVRIPYGASDGNLVAKVAADGAQIFDWDIDSCDSSRRGVHDHRFIERAVLNKLSASSRKHAIVLFHDGPGHDETLAALRDLIPVLKRKGYRFGLLSRNDKVARLATAPGKMP